MALWEKSIQRIRNEKLLFLLLLLRLLTCSAKIIGLSVALFISVSRMPRTKLIVSCTTPWTFGKYICLRDAYVAVDEPQRTDSYLGNTSQRIRVLYLSTVPV